MRVLLVFGRRVGPTAVKNLQLLKELSKYKPEYEFLDLAHWDLMSFDSEYESVIEANYFKNIHVLSKLSFDKYRSMVYEIHPKPKKIGRKALKHFSSLCYVISEVSEMVMATDETGKGRPAFALKAAKNMFVPNLNLSSKETTKKITGLIEEMQANVKKDKDLLLKYLDEFQSKFNMEFQLTDKIDLLERSEILNCINTVKGLV